MHYEVLEEKTRKIFEKFSFLKENFYLAGGTALALQIGHRKSIDLDFFSDEPIKKTLLKTIESKIKTADSVVVNNKKELTFYIESIKVTFLHYPFSHKHFSVKNNIFPLASISEIASMKAYALGRRAALKDYVDLYFILSLGMTTLMSIIADATEIYQDAFNDRLFCEQLLSTEDSDDESIIWIAKEVSKAEMKIFFSNLIAKEKNQILEMEDSRLHPK
ncbi:hypothetical protein A2643_03925 [Candidatus Nomurabacteria bacterium RIFCSPHIGHO2_01_FULL_39_220]|uniref:Nucleotidyl transferase AbiEii/AbiGii toxin family protein n=1 Tax=Candidatus Nomurabacteria bacterium RIFCSPLOWO2_02_FULL_40_67 TaxID=1801787 RepID=A0A1F6Y5P4_9BACT|nr:MAG: hypothetical protein UU01_C0004G0038 [Parcubacteria group bacterium GW2011_GWA2_40_37]KKS11577.1 MAG: hypothetical protein UU66_C0014G0010 [Parcubacteria group bacterium GW2011_GWB1_41_5]KKS71349.1 MAG: hypothetical protein UV43_C0040G0019 [Parcubacteria group bacterium GW2011_GWF2_42_7]OGI62827.1 MAG: hypothetical protein A2W12_03495 [Candidatus Nomurabacteria bacterium RBG_16_40_11]OGI69754.1 MAG: hypothetical protein A2643_03925 [Candidatus Nomurabacteria bacterium RIFCSPHIGHO2_01_FU